MTESNTVDPKPASAPATDEPTDETLPASDTDGSADHRTGEDQAQENRENESPA